VVGNRRSLSIALFAITMFLSSIARADAPSDRAEALFEEGQQLLKAGNVAAACAKLEESYRLDPALGTLLNTAFCHGKQGRIGLAWREYRTAFVRATKDNQAQRAKFAQERATELEARLVRLRVTDAGSDKVEAIRVDGDPVEGDLDVVFVEPGRHAIDLVVSSRGEQRTNIDASPPEVRVAVRAKDAPPPPPPPPPRPPVPNPAPAPDSSQRTIGWALLGVGAVGLGLGTAFGIKTFADKDAIGSDCFGEVCTAEGKKKGDTAHTSALISTISFGVGIAAAGAGVYFLVSAPGAVAVAGRW